MSTNFYHQPANELLTLFNTNEDQGIKSSVLDEKYQYDL